MERAGGPGPPPAGAAPGSASFLCPSYLFLSGHTWPAGTENTYFNTVFWCFGVKAIKNSTKYQHSAIIPFLLRVLETIRAGLNQSPPVNAADTLLRLLQGAQPQPIQVEEVPQEDQQEADEAALDFVSLLKVLPGRPIRLFLQIEPNIGTDDLSTHTVPPFLVRSRARYSYPLAVAQMSSLIEKKCFTEKYGTHQCMLAVRENLLKLYGSAADEAVIDRVLRYGTASRPRRSK